MQFTPDLTDLELPRQGQVPPLLWIYGPLWMEVKRSRESRWSRWLGGRGWKPGPPCGSFSPPVRWGLLDFMSACFSSSSSSSPPSPLLARPTAMMCVLPWCVCSIACQTITAIMRGQCGAPDLNRDHARSVWRAGPQPRLWGQCCVPDLNRDHVRPVLRAGPQPRCCAASVACRTSTAIMWVQRGSPDLNRDLARSVWRAGPQPRRQKICQEECQKICQKECQKIC